MIRIWILNRKTGFTCCLIAILLISFLYISQNKSVFTNCKERLLPICCVENPQEEKIIAFSFDTSNMPEKTEEILEILKRNKIKSTFFIVGKLCENNPDLVKKIQDGAHEIGNHSYAHPDFTKLSSQEIENEIKTCGDKIKEITGISPTLFRFPYGAYNNEALNTAKALGYHAIQWDIDTEDWLERKNSHGSKDIKSEILNKISKNSSTAHIVLMHTSSRATVACLDKTIQEIKSKNYKIVPISEILLKENYEIDALGKQISLKLDTSEKQSNSSK